MRDSFADATGVRIHCIDHGGSGPDLIAVHATGFHARVWDPYVAPLRDRFRVVAIDQRGHGRSDKPDDGYEWERFGDDVLAAVDHLGLDRPRGIGHSAGAAALVFAETSRPGTFDRLVLLDPVTPPPRWRDLTGTGDNPMAHSARRRRAVWDSREQMIERMRHGTPLKDWTEESLRAYVEHGTEQRPDGTFELLCPPEVEAQVYEMSRLHEGWERLSDLRCPTLFVGGTDAGTLWPDVSVLSELNPALTTATVHGTHFFPMENPGGTLSAISAFLEA